MISNEKYRDLIKGMIDQMEDNSNLRTVFMSVHQMLINEGVQVERAAGNAYHDYYSEFLSE